MFILFKLAEKQFTLSEPNQHNNEHLILNNVLVAKDLHLRKDLINSRGNNSDFPSVKSTKFKTCDINNKTVSNLINITNNTIPENNMNDSTMEKTIIDVVDESQNIMQISSDHINPEWQIVRSKKRRYDESVISSSTSQVAALPTHNSFDPLRNITENESHTESLTPHKPPPIFVPGVINVPEFINCLRQKVSQSDFSYKMYKEEVKILPNTVEAYRLLIRSLNDKNAMYHTYQLKHERTFRVVLRNMHYSIDKDSIIHALHELGHRVRNIHNIQHRVTKEPLPLFYIDLEPQPNNKEIYDIKYLLHAKISFEPPYKKKDVVQCARCQLYGHTKKYCKRLPRCIKCGNDHLSNTCQKDKSTPATCALCSGNHPANYKGCVVYQDIVRRRYPSSTTAEIPKAPRQPVPSADDFPQLCPTSSQRNTAFCSFAQKVTQEQSTDITNIIQESYLRFENLMKQQAEQIGTLLNLLTVLISKLK